MGYLAVAPDLVAGGGWRCIARLFRDLRRGQGESVDKGRGSCRLVADAHRLLGNGRLHRVLPRRGLRIPARRPRTGRCHCSQLRTGCRRTWRKLSGGRFIRRQGPGLRTQRREGCSSALGRWDRSRCEALCGCRSRIHESIRRSRDASKRLGARCWPSGISREAAEDAWTRIEAFFARYLSAAPPPPQS